MRHYITQQGTEMVVLADGTHRERTFVTCKCCHSDVVETTEEKNARVCDGCRNDLCGQ